MSGGSVLRKSAQNKEAGVWDCWRRSRNQWVIVEIILSSIQLLTFSCAFANGHIMLNTPVLVRSLKLSNIEPSQYLDGWPPGNTGCCWLTIFFWFWVCARLIWFYKHRFPQLVFLFFENKLNKYRIVNASSEEARKIVYILNWCLSHTEIFSKRRKIYSWLSERLELNVRVEKYSNTNPDCLKCPLNWNWAWMCELCCLENSFLQKVYPSATKAGNRP